jgi:dolichol-phosphate mannosyltransferase
MVTGRWTHRLSNSSLRRFLQATPITRRGTGFLISGVSGRCQCFDVSEILACLSWPRLPLAIGDLFDPTNGYTAIHAEIARRLPFDSISTRYFFESDILFRLNVMRAKVLDVPMDARYADEVSGLKVSKIVGEFFVKHLRNVVKRIGYNYFLRDMSMASIELLIGLPMLLFGTAFGLYHWVHSAEDRLFTPLGTIMLAALSVMLGLQLLLAFLSHETSAMPRHALHPLLLRYPAARPSSMR